jgi:uncharacterized repeat protein (TIGR03987 family)
MPRELILPATMMTLAFVLYTTGVFAERAARDIKPWHLAFFWGGLACDSIGTEMMAQLLGVGARPTMIHAITGAAALILMLVHAIWATWTLTRGTAETRAGFHRYSIAVWVVWLVPYFGGMIAGMTKGLNIG